MPHRSAVSVKVTVKRIASRAFFLAAADRGLGRVKCSREKKGGERVPVCKAVLLRLSSIKSINAQTHRLLLQEYLVMSISALLATRGRIR